MSAKATFWAWSLELSSMAERTVLLCLANSHNIDTDQCNPSIAYIAQKSCCNIKTVHKVIKSLSNSGVLSISKSFNKSNSYTFNFSVVILQNDDELTSSAQEEKLDVSCNGSTKNGSTKNGSTKNGSTKNGSTKNGSTKNGCSEYQKRILVVPKTVLEPKKNLNIESKIDISDQSSIELIDQSIKKIKNFIKPNLDEIANYFSTKTDWDYSRCSDLANRFFDHYETNGWRVGKSPMKNWEAACRTWIRNNNQYPTNQNNYAPSLPNKSSEQAQGNSFVNKHTDRSWADGL